MLNRVLVLSFLTPVLVLCLACGEDEETTGDSDVVEPSSVTVEQDVELADFSIEPAVIEATVGNTIDLTLNNGGEQAHTFTIDEFVVDEEVAAGRDSEVTFIPNQAGEFNYYCRFHPDRMQGALRIAREGEEPPGGDAEASPTEDTGDGGGYGY